MPYEQSQATVKETVPNTGHIFFGASILYSTFFNPPVSISKM